MTSPTILLFGIPSESPLKLVTEALSRLGADVQVVDQREFAGTHFAYLMMGDQLSGTLDLRGRSIDLRSVAGVYVRLMDGGKLPDSTASPTCAVRSALWHATVTNWLELFDGRIVNRLSAMASNASKPYQAQLIQALGFAIPETLVTNDPNALREFLAHHNRVVFKSASGVRSIVQEFKTEHAAKLERIRACPTQFQRFIDGTNVRVHVVGTEIFATLIESDVIDYRYAGRFGGTSQLTATRLGTETEARCIRLANALGLAFAGLDLILAEDGCTYCLEVNPSPGFSYFENATGQLIADAVARYLCYED